MNVLVLLLPVAAANTEAILDAYQSMRSHPGVFLRINGTDNSTSFQTDLTYFEAPDGYYLNLVNARSNIIRQRCAANGSTFFDFRPLPNEFLASPYKLSGNNAPDPKQQLLVSLSASTQGLDAWGARLIQEVYANPLPLFRPWIPGSRRVDVVHPNPGYTNPMDDKVYKPTPIKSFVAFEGGDPVWRTIIFEIVFQEATSGDAWTLGAIYFNEQQRGRAQTAKMTVLSLETMPDAALFQFTPPTNAKPLNVAQRNGG